MADTQDLGIADDQEPAQGQPPGRMFSSDEFAGVIRKLYPTLAQATPDNNKLTAAILKVHPEFRSRVIDPTGGIADATQVLGYNPTTTKMVPRPYGVNIPPAPLPEAGEADQTPALRRASAKGGPGNVPTTVGELRAGARRQDESIAGQVLASPVTGTVRALKGAEPLLQGAQGVYLRALAKGTPQEARINAKYPPMDNRDLAQGAADVIGGGMEAATVALPEALIGAPVEVATALAAGTAAATATQKAGEAMNAPPAYIHLASELAGLTVGIAGGAGAKGVMERRAAAAKAPLYDQMAVEHANAVTDAAREHALAEGGMQADFRAANDAADADQSMANVLAYKNRQIQDAEVDKLSLGLAENYRLNRIAAKMKEAGPHPGSAFDALDRFAETEAPPAALPAAPEPAGLLGPGSPATFLAGPSDQEYPGHIDLNQIDPVGDTRPIATSEVPPPPLIQTIGEQVASGLENRPPGALNPRPTEATRVQMKERQGFKNRVRQVANDAVSEMDDMPHSRGVSFYDEQNNEQVYTPPVAGSEWYWRIVGKDAQNPPSRATIGEYMRAYKDSDGALTGKDLPDAVVAAGQKALDLKTPGGFRRAYEEWAPEIHKQFTRRATAIESYTRRAEARAAAERLAQERAAPNGASSAAVDETASSNEKPGTPAAENTEGTENVEVPRTDLPLEKPGENPPAEGGAQDRPATPPSEEPAGPPSPLSSTGTKVSNEPPKRLRTPEEERSIAEAEDLYNALHPDEDEPTPGNGTGEPLSEDELFKRDAQELADHEDNYKSLSDFFGRMGNEEGHLILTVAPGNKRGLKEWLAKHADEYGNEEWHQKATEALEEGDTQTAWRVAAMASSRSLAAAGARGATDREHQPITLSPAEIAAETQRQKKVIASTEKQLGYKLPKDTTVNRDTGVIEFPENGGVNLKARFSDLTLGKSFLNDVLDQVDATSIIRVEDESGHLDEKFVSEHPEMRITSQMADQIVRDMPDAVKDAFEQTGLTPVQIGAHFRRAFRQAGQVLNMAKQWQDTHWDDILHLDPLTGSTAGPGAAGRLEFLPPERAKVITDYLEGKRKLTNDEIGEILPDMLKLSPKKLKELGFDLPDGVDPDSKQARSYTQNWLNRQQRMVQLGKEVDAIAADNGVDKALVASSLGATDETVPGKIRETYLSLMRARLSFLISQASTGFHVLASQGGRYAFGIPEELFSSAAAAVSGDAEGAAQHLTFAKNLVKNVTREGKIPMGLIKRPWSDGIENLFEYSTELARGMDPNDVRKTLAAMGSEAPEHLHHMMATLTLGDPDPEVAGSSHVINPKVTNFLTAFMRFHAGMYRSMVSDAMIRTAIEMKGDDPNVVLAQEGGLTLKYGEEEAGRIFGAAAAQALNYTQAADPYPGTFPAWIGSVFEWSKYPELAAIMRMGVPFPRFTFGNIPRYIWDRMPGTIIADIARAKFPVFGKGRLGLGLERSQIENVNIPHLEMQRAAAEHEAATTLGDLIQANDATKNAAKAFKAVEARAKNTGDLLGVHDELMKVREDLLAQINKKAEAQAAYKAANTKANNIEGILTKQNAKLGKLNEIDAPDWKQAIARQTQGALFLTAAIGIRNSQDDDTKWSDIRVKDPINGGTVDIDTKWAAGLSQFLLPADVIVNFQRHTDWKVVKDTLDKEGWNYKGMVDAMRAGYNGKYTTPELAKEAAEAFFSLSPVIGGMSSFVDMTTGRTAEGSSVLDAPFDVLATFLGQTLGAFTLPARQFGDLIGQFYEPERRSYTPEAPGKYGSIAKEIAQPVIQNIPGVREMITPKVNALTGEPNENPLSAFKPLGVSAKVIGKIEREMTAIGLPYAEAVPKVTGDREFDNEVNRQYADILKNYTDQLLAIEEYKGANPAMRRDLFKQALGQIKQAALYLAGEKLGLTDESTHDKLESPKTKERREMYQRYMDELSKQVTPEKDEEAAPATTPRTGAGAPPPPL